ncbi:glycosyltransferase [Xanthobacter sp. DSM 24535]|uniref:glycosyltransferase n=1 Tax=Roseixanthobacter psychrophilus TaxID=3119917 RepID=UPI0037298073
MSIATGHHGLLDEAWADPATLFRRASATDEEAARPLIALAEAERVCRSKFLDEPSDLLQLAHAYLVLGRSDGAARAARRILELTPDDPSAMAILFGNGTLPERERAALGLAGAGIDTALRIAALRALRAAGHQAFAHLNWSGNRLAGFAAWPPGAQATLMLVTPDGTESWLLDPEVGHPLATAFGHAAEIDLQLASMDAHVFVTVAGARYGLLRQTAPGAALVRRAAAPDDGHGETLTILIPVYDDVAATKRCIDSVLAHRPSPQTRVLLVADDPPDSALRAYLSSLAEPGLEVLHNPLNLGFVGAVNRGIAATPHGDILLLNADTVVPAGFAQRLRATAYGSPDIGTVVPLSNNGEFVSLPVPFRANPLPSLVEIDRIDESAQRVNSGMVIDLPSGIGFCLYLTRRCLNDVAQLSGGWGRGYLEDADLCLRARAFGWRNVCATDIYVGHEGTRSFKEEKRGLVVRNLKRIGVAFPAYEAACGSFVAADPLRTARAAIEAELSPPPGSVRLLIHGPRLADAAEALLREEERLPGVVSPVLQGAVTGRAGAFSLTLTAQSGGFPQNLRFDLEAEDGPRALVAELGRRPIATVEVLGHEPLPERLWQVLAGLGTAVTMRVYSLRGLSGITGRMWPAFTEPAVTVVLPANDQIEQSLREQRLALPWKVHAAPTTFRRFDRASVPLSEAPVGVLLPYPAPGAHLLVRDLALALRAAGGGNALFVFGNSLDDRFLGSLPDMIVLGKVSAEEAPALMAALEIGRTVIVDRDAIGHPLAQAAGEAAMPCAFFGTGPGAQGDLILAPDTANSEAAQQIADWIRSRFPA